MLHLAGDMHQPLHRGHRMDSGWLKTDRAATIAFVRRVPGGPAMDLHESWDSAASLPGPDPQAAERLYPRIAAVAARLPAERVPARIENWAAASEVLARDVAYTGSALGATPDEASAPVLDAAYQAKARALAEQRIARAGVRIAEVLGGLRP